MNDKREQLYNNLLGSGMVDESNIGTIDEFKGAIKDEQSARQFYNNLVGFGFNDSQIGSEDDFYNSISSDFQPQQETYPQEVEDAYNDPKNAAPYFKDKSQLNKEFQNGNMTVGNDKPSFWERMFSMDNLNAAGKAFNSHVASNAQTPYQEPTPKPAEEEVHYNTPKPQQVVVGRGEEPSLEQIQQAADSSKQVQQTIQQQQQWKAEDEAMDFVPKKVETEKDILDNAQGRFAMTEEGKALKAEADEAMLGYVDQLSEEFKESPEYKELTKVQPKNQQELDELNKKLNEAFQQKYETQLDEFAQPYEKKMGDALFNRYGDDIDNQLKKLGAKNAEEDLIRISGEVDDMYKKKVGTWDDEKKRLAAKFGQHRVNLTEQDKEAYENAVANDADLRNLTASKHLIEESNEIVNAVKNGDEAALKQMFRGLWDNLDARNFTFGLSEMADNATILQALQKAEKGEKLTDAEEKLLEAQVTNMAVKGYYAEQLSLGYKVGQTTGASLPFMLEFIANPIARSGNAIAKGLLKYGMKQAGKRLGLGAAKAFNTAPVKFAGRLVGDALAASGMLATTSMPGVTADTMERLSNNYEVKMEDGEPVVTMKDETVTPFDAWSDAMQTRFIENQSEMVFNAFKGFNPFGQVKLPNNVASFINMVRESAPGRLYRDILGNKTLREFAQAAQFHGLPEEYLEEVYNNFANVLTGEMDAKDALSLDRNIETFLGLVPTTLMFGALGVGSYARERRAFREKYGKMTDEQKEKYEYLREMAKNGKKSLNREVKRFLNETFNADNLTPEERRSEIEFLFDSVKGITMEEIDAERTPEQKVQDGVEEAEMDGAEAVEPADMNRIGVDLEVATQEMDNIFGATTRTMFDADPMAAAADVMNNPNYTAEEKQVAIDYLNAKTAYNSMIGRIREDIGREVEESNAEIDNRTDAETGAVRPATLKNGGRQVYIMNGNVVMYEDGSGVDIGNSSKDVIVKDAETGKLEFIPASDISSIEQPIPAEQLKEETAANIQQTKAQEEADKINGTLAFQQGDTYQAMGEDGTQVELTIISDNGDGSVNVGINGEATAVPMAKETVQQMADRFKQQQAQKASIERRAATAVEEQATEPVATESVEQAPVQEEVAPVVEKTAAETAPESVEEQEEPMPMMGEGENMQPDYGAATPQRTSRYIYDENGLEEKDADQLVQMKRKAAEKVLSDTKKAKPEFGDKGIGDNIVKLKQARAAWEQSVADAQRQVDYWNAVEQEHAMAVRQREEASAQAAQQPVVQEEAPVVEQEAVETPAAETQEQPVETAPAEAEVAERNRVEEQPVDEKEPLRERAREWEKKLGVPVRIIENVDDVPNQKAMKAIKSGISVVGWFEPSTGEVCIYMPFIRDSKEIDNTYIHEVVAHKGLRQLLGTDAFNKLCDEVWASMSEEDREKYKNYPGVSELKGKNRERAAADEYIAALAEETDLNPTLWEKIVAAVREALRELGMDVRMTNDDIAYILNRSYDNLVEANAELLRDKGAEVDTERGDVRFAVKDILKGKELDNTVKELMAVTGRSEKTVRKWIKAEESLAKVILDDDNVKFLDMQVDESVPSIWNNSDYPQGTVEFSNICRKRLPFTMIYQRLQKEFPNMVFSASTLEDIRNTMKQNGVDVACGLCFVEDRRQLLGEIGQGFIDALEGKNADLSENQTKALSQIDDKYIPNLYDLLTLDGMKKLRKEHPSIAKAFIEYNNARGMQAGRLFQAYSAYHREILTYPKSKVKKINDNGGLRIFSFSDFEAHHLIDLVQVLTDAASKGIKVQGYTKVPEFAKAVKDTKLKMNRSLIAKDKGYVDADYQPKEGEAVSPNVIDGKRLLLDTVEGINVNHPDFFDSTSNPNVGNILVGINDEQIKLAMRDPFVDYIIPFHSGLSENIRQKKGIGEWVNYKLKQLEKKQNEDGKLTNADKHGINIYTDVLPRGNELIGHEIKNAKDFQKAFLAACAEKGWIPRFWEFIDKDKKGNYKYTPGYEKMLIDFKLFDKNGKIVPQEAVVPVFDNDFNKQILDDYVKGEKEKMPNDELYEKIKESLGLAEGEETRFRVETPWWSDSKRPESLDANDYHTYMTPEAVEYFSTYKSEDGEVDFTKYAHPRLAFITAAVWDGVDIPVDKLIKVPEIQEAERRVESNKGSLSINEDEERELANRLIDDKHGSQVYKDGKKVKDDYSGHVRQDRKAMIVIGRPAGGKSSVFADKLSHDNEARIIDSDTVKPWLEGYDDGYGAGYVQDASAKVAQFALFEAAKRGDNMVIPRVGGNSVIGKTAIPLIEMGYDVQLYYNDVSEQTSIMRAASRFAEKGRYISLQYLTTIGNKVSKIFSNFANKKLDDYYAERNEKESADQRHSVSSSGSNENVLADGGSDSRRIESSRSGTGSSVRPLVQDTREREESRQGKSEVPGKELIFSYSEWRNNDVPLGEKPKEVWNSKSGEPMPDNGTGNVRFRVSQEEHDIESKAKADGTWMKAPNGKPSNLNEKQWVQVRTKAFKNWFGNWENDPNNSSKVVDENGEPKVMYHGTNLTQVNNGNPFWIFYENSHFGTEGQAKDVLKGINSYPTLKTYEVFLNIRNPQRRSDASQEYLNDHDMTMSEYWQQSVERSKGRGYDGIVYLNEYEGETPEDSWIAFRPNQIKSATENNGEYSNENPDIRFRITPEEDAEYMDAVNSGDMEKAAEMVKAAAKKAMPDTKVVDENGVPKMVYHSTNSDFSVFDKEKLGLNTDENADSVAAAVTARLGFWESDTKEVWQEKAMPLFLNIEKPEEYTSLSDLIDSIETFIGENGLEDSDAQDIADRYIDYYLKNNDGIVVVNDHEHNNTSSYVVFNPNQIKSAEPVTYDDEGKVIPLSQRFNDTSDDIRFRVSEEEAEMRDALADKLNEVGIETSVAPVYYSNAEKAVQDIKQEKATPEQWLKMIEKNGGLKAGEDKWTGLSDWLKNSNAKTLTKQEVVDYINQNQIQIEEQGYVEYSDNAAKRLAEFNDEFHRVIAKLIDENPEMDRNDATEKAYDEMKERYGDDFEMAFELTPTGNGDFYLSPVLDWNDEPSDAARHFLENDGNRTIHGIRLDYTTRGLENKREIALTIPTIESWNEGDTIHFGDAGEGRAVAWVRFGDTTIDVPEDGGAAEAEFKRIMRDNDKWYEEHPDFARYGIGDESMKQESEERKQRQRDALAAAEAVPKHTEKVLVIDEIQSKRHQEGRESGYKSELASSPKGRWVEAVKSSDSFSKEMRQKYGGNYLLDQLTEEERKRHEELVKELNEASNYQDEKLYNIPDAPFEKNWHELAMKRMLRYAAENGYDKIAWTTGAQQADRYDIGKKINDIIVSPAKDGGKLVSLNFRHDEGYMDFYQMQVNDDGKIIEGDFDGNNLSDIVGKDLAVKLLASNGRQVFANENLRVGGEGMRGFYDEMLPRFMNKYGKKWGVKVEDVKIPRIGDGYHGLTMHSVDVTPEMKESVMQGQPMFHRTTDGRAYGYTQDGKIYIDPRIATSETPIHEYAHLWAEALRRGNAEEWDNVVNLMKGTSIWNDVANNYPELNTDDLLAEEVLAHYSGSRGAARLRKAQEDAMNNANGVFEKAEVASAFDSVRRALSRFWKAVADFLNIHYTSADEVADRVLNDLLSGVNPNEVASIDGDAEVRFRVIDDQETIDRLESEPQETGYRNVVLNEDGTLGSPMAGKLGGKNGRKATSSFEMNRWEMAEENPDIANENGKVDLIKPNGKPVSGVDYNPYIHIRPTMVNTQFKEAWKRPELVYVKTAYPASELNGEYKAEKAKLSVGRHPWNGGELILSRYDKPVEIMSWEEVADDWMNEFDGKGIHFDIIPPELLPILAERGAEILPPHKGAGKACEDAYNAFKAQQEQSGDIRFSIRRGENSGYTLREDGSSISVRANAAEEDGKFTKGKFRQVYGISAKAFDILRKLGLILSREWHHTGLSFNESDYYEWRDHNQAGYENGIPEEGSLGDTYNKNKKEIDALAKEMDSAEYQYKPLEREQYVMPFEDYVRQNTPNWEGLLSDEERDAYRNEQDRISGLRDSGVSSYERREMHREVEDEYKAKAYGRVDRDAIRQDYERDYGDAIRHNENIDDRNAATREYNAKTNGKESILVKIGRLMGLSENDAVGRAYSDARDAANRRRADEIGKIDKEIESLRNEAKDKQQKYLQKALNEGKAEGFTRETSEPEMSVITKEEMHGRYGWFAASPSYRLPVYYSGYKFKDTRSFNHYNKLAHINDEQIEEKEQQKLNGYEGEIRFSISDDVANEINGKEYNAGVKTFDEAITEGLAELVRKNKDAVQTRADVLHRVNNQLRDLIDRLTSREAAERDTPTPRLQVPGSVRSAASAQRAFDKSTVDEIVRLTRMLMSKGFIGELPAVEVKRLMGYVNNAVGRKDIIKQAKLVVDLLLKHQIDNARKALEKQLSVRGSKVGSKGVEVQGRLDVAGQKALKAFKEYYDKDADTIQCRIEDCMNRMSEEGPAGADAAAEYQGLMMAKRYNEDIKASETEEFNLKKEIEDENRKMKEGDPEAMSKEEFEEWREAAWEAIRKNRMDRLDAYVGMLRDFGGALRMSVEKAKAFREEEQSRVRKIYHFANSDMQGVPSDEHSKVNFMQRLSNAPVFRFLLSPMISFDSMLRFFGRKSPDGRGYLWNHFMSEWVKRNDEEWKSLKKGHDQLDAKVMEIFGDGVRKWSDLFTMERGMQKVPVEFWDGGQKKSHELTQGNMLYIYMVNKMDDGKMKLRRMGISEEDVDRITEILDPRFIKLADWVQDVFLKEKRIRYNEVHERMFGAPMASIDNYFPLVINSRSRGAEVDVALQESDKKPATITGNIIKRVKNSTALDITNVDAFDLVLAHLQQMEHWAAFAELNRDMNTLLSYRHFRNQLMNMVSAQYGSGKKLLDNFKDACAIAGGAYTPKIGQDSLDKHIVNIAKGVTAAKIALRLYTAMKQLLSYPAYLSEASVVELAKSSLNPKGIAESWNWAIEKLPGFAERWQSRKAGDNRLDDTELDYAFWKNRIVETASRWGMSPNAFVDALTVSMGSKAIYETKKKQYLKDGYDEARAEELALRDASVAYNETQQSSGSAYMSPVQLDRTALAVALTVFRNSSIGYQRRMNNSLRNLSHMASKEYREESEAFTEKQLRRDGLFDAIKERLINEGMDEEKATAEADMAVHEAAERAYNRAMTRSAVDVVIFGFIMQFAWNLGSYMPYIGFGDDDDKKKEMLLDAAMHALVGGLEGMAGGSVISDIYNKVRKGDNMSGYNINPLPLMSDIQNTLTKVQSDRLYTINNAVNIIMQSLVGINPETITDIVLAFDDAANGNLDGLHEFAFLMMRLANFPQSQLDELYIDELDLKGKDAVQMNPAELAKRYAEYKSKRNAPLLYWMYSDAEKDKLQQKFIKRFEEKKKERVLMGGDPEVMSVIDGYKESDAYTKTQDALDSIAAMPKDERKEQRDSLYETEEGAMHRAVTKAETKINSFAKKGNTKAVEYLRSEMARMIEGKISVEDFEEELKGFSE